jgi:hypothetical protein
MVSSASWFVQKAIWSRTWRYPISSSLTSLYQILDSINSDDGPLTSEDPAEVEHFKGLYTVGFARVGMNTKTNETSAKIMSEDEFLAFIGPRKWTHRIANKACGKCVRALRSVHDPTLSQILPEDEESQLALSLWPHCEQSLQKVRCERCGAYMIRHYLKTYQKTKNRS